MTAPSRPATRTRRRRAAGWYAAIDRVLVRAPLLPVEVYHSLESETDAAPRDPRVLAALAVGGGDLSRAVQVDRGGAPPDARVRAKLQRYLIRMSTRPTPYGLFAAVGLARPGERTDLALAASEPRTRTRPDMAWVLGLVGELEERPELRRQLRFRANTAACVHAGRVFLSERAVSGEGDLRGDAVSLRATRPVLLALELARQLRPWSELVAEIADATGASEDKAEALMSELWRQTLLLSELRPPLTGDSPAGYVRDRLAELPTGRQAAASLGRLLDDMAAWDAVPLAERLAGYSSLAARAREVSERIDAPPPQVDSALSLAGRHISTEVLEHATRAAELLLRLNPIGVATPLQGYRRAFEGRYGTQREVPLLELLDPEAGLGLPSPQGWRGRIDAKRSAHRDQLLWEIAVEAVRDRRREIVLDDDMLAALEVADVPPNALPASLDLAVFVLAESPAAIDAGEFRLLVGPNLGAQAAGRNLGRFADLLGAEAAEALAAAAAGEEVHWPGELAVELVYLPLRARSANVVIRPAVRGHELVVGTSPGVAPERSVPADELVVGMRGDRFYVRWPQGGTEVRAHAGHMLNSMQAPAVCRFLEDVARDGTVSLSSFDWGSAARLPYLPRVRAGRIVLEPARWRVDVAARDRELAGETAETFARNLAAWRAAWAVPRHVYLTMGDNRLLIDLQSPAQAEQLRQELGQLSDQGAVVLDEPLPDPDAAWLPGPEGHYVTELVISMVRRHSRTDPVPTLTETARAPMRAATRSERLRPPGSDWLFLRLYSSRAADEDLITGPVRSICEFAVAAGMAAEWFFIRYADPDPHLRLRFRGEPDTLLERLLPEVCRWATDLLEQDRCSRFALDTYDREVERYGGEEATTVAESVFAADSRAVAELLDADVHGRSPLDRTALAVVSIDDLLAGLGLDERARLAWYRANVTARHESGDEYRRRRDELRRLVGTPPALATLPGGEELLRALKARRDALTPLGEHLRALAAAERLERTLDELCSSHVHLHCNRLLGPGPPTETLVLGLLLRTREGLERTGSASVRPD